MPHCARNLASFLFFSFLISSGSAPAVPVAVDDAYSVNEDTQLNVGPVTIFASTFDSSVVGGAWDYLDEIKNQLSASPKTYPVDGSGRGWKDLNFQLASSTVAPWKSNALPIQRGGLNGISGAPDVLAASAFGGAGPSGTENPVTTFLFRKIFTLTAPQAAELNWTLRYLVDDGMVVYVNGTEIAKVNLASVLNPDGVFNTNTSTTTSGNEATYTNLAVTLPPGLLVAGANVMAIEVHQTSSGGLLTSSDAGLDLSFAPASYVAGDGFTYVANPFGTTSAASSFASGSASATAGFGGSGGLTMACGSLTALTRPSSGPPLSRRSSSAGWTRSFTVPGTGTKTVQFSLRHRLISANGHESNEESYVLLDVNGTKLQDSTVPFVGGAGTPYNYLARIGVGSPLEANGSGNIDNGWKTSEVSISLPAGIYALIIGAFDASANDLATLEQTQLTIDDVSATIPAAASLLVNDTGGAVSAILDVGTTHGTLALQPNGEFSYLPTANYFGLDSFTYFANDGAVNSGIPATVTIDVLPVNDAPAAAADSYSTPEDQPLTVAAPGVLTNDSDAEGTTLTANLVASPTHGSVSLQPDGSFVYTPTANYFGPDSFSYRASDGVLNSTTTLVSLTVTAVDDAPVAVGNSYSGEPAQPLVIAAPGVLGNDTDIDNVSLTAQVVSPPAQGTLVLQSDGSFTYTPAGAGTFSFTYQASDGTLLSEPATVTLMINAAPVATGESYNLNEDTPLNVAAPGVLANDADAEFAPLSATLIQSPAHGTVTLAANGGFLYTPTLNYVGTDSFTYSASDGQVSSAPATVSLTMAPVSDPPAASADSYNGFIDTTLSVPAGLGLLANDNDPDAGDMISVASYQQPAHGTLNVELDGGFTYQPDPGYSGPDTFTYRISDGARISTPATVTLDIAGSNTAVIISEIMYSPPNGVTTEEFIELENTSNYTVDLSGWRFTQGISFTFPASTLLAPGARLVIAANPAVFSSKYPAVANFLNVGWSSTTSLSNRFETLRIVDASGTEVDQVAYASDGDWGTRQAETVGANTGWKWVSGADGLGQSLQVHNPRLDNNNGQNWSSAAPTPGAVNAQHTTDLAPLISKLKHHPEVPTSTQQVFITCTLADELPTGSSAKCYYRVLKAANPQDAFVSINLFDDGLHADNAAGDHEFGAALPAQANGAIVEFYVESTDGTLTRTWPPAALNTAGNAFLANDASPHCLYQVDNSVWTQPQPIYRIIMSKVEGDAFVAASYNTAETSDTDKNISVIFATGADSNIRYQAGLRYRGAGSRGGGYGPHNWKLSLANDNDWQNWTSFNLNSLSAPGLVLAGRLLQCAQLPGEIATPAAVRFNGTNRMDPSAVPAPSSLATNLLYSHQTPMNTEWAATTFPANGGGNIYKKNRGAVNGWHLNETSPGLPDIAGYINDAWIKQSNTAENKWNDLNNFISVMRSATSNATNPPSINIAQAATVANLDQWARWWAFNVIVNHRETNLSNGVDDDYSFYFGTTDSRCVLLSHDFDTILGSIGDTSTASNATIWQAYDTGFLSEKSFASAGLDIPRALFFNNTFVRMFKGQLRELLGTVFSATNFDNMVDNTWGAPAGNWVEGTKISTIKSFMTARRSYILTQLPSAFTFTSTITPSGGVYTTPNPDVTGLSGTMDGSRTASILINNVPAVLNNHDDTWNTTGVIAGLEPGYNTVLIRVLDAANAEITRQTLTYFYDDATITPITSNVSANTTWSAGDGPFEITNSISIEPGSTLNIEPGTTVYVAPSVNISVASGGILNAVGSESAPIRFMQKSGVTTNWGGLTINGTAGSPRSTLAWVIFDKNNNTALHTSSADVSLDHLTFLNPAKQYLSLDGSSFEVSNCVFPSATAQFEPVHGTGGVRAGGRGIIRDCWFGKPIGYSDVVDFTGGKRPSPIVRFYRNTFIGSDDDILDLDGTDAWVEGNLFMHCHRNASSPDSSSAVSGGSDSGHVSNITVLRNMMYDCDNGVTMKQGNSAAVLYNTMIHTTKVGGIETGSGAENDIGTGVLNLADEGIASGNGFVAEGNIIWDAESLTRNYRAATPNVNFINNILPTAWSGVGSGNSVIDPLLNLNLIPTPGTATEAQVRAAYVPQSCSAALGTGARGWDKGATAPAGIAISRLLANRTNASTATFTFGPFGTFSYGTPVWNYGYVAYRWSLDGGAVSAEIPSSTPLVLTGLTNGTHTLSVEGKTDAANWQDAPPTTYTFTVNTALPSVLLWEVLADNRTAHALGTTHPDYIEIYNYGSGSVNLTNYGLTDDATKPLKYKIPASTIIPPGGFKVFYCDSLSSQGGELHTGFGLDSGGETLGLYAPGAIAGATPIDSISFGPQLPDKSIGRAGVASAWTLATPSPSAVNLADCDFGSTSVLKLNEWLANHEIVTTQDFIEIYNPSTKIVNLGGMMLTDDNVNYAALLALNDPHVQVLPPLSFIAPNGFVRFQADSSPTGGDHLNFKLSSFHNGIALIDSNGTMRDHVITYPQSPDVSVGRLPDGAESYANFVLPTPALSNGSVLTTETSQMQNLRVTELMYAPTNGQAEYIEFQNIGATPLVVTGIHFANGITFTFPTLTIPAGGYTVITDNSAKFTAQFPGVPALQWTGGALKNEGEGVRYEVAGYNFGILDFNYEPWYPSTLGGGAALQIIDPLAPRASWSLAESWQPGFPSPGGPSAFGVLAGLDSTVVLPATGVMDGSLFAGTYSPASITTQWTKQSGPGTVNFTAPLNPDTSASFSDPGTYVLRLTATVAGGPTAYSELSLNVVADYSTWINGFYPGNNNPLTIGKTADPDRDGISNLLEFAFGTNPSVNSQAFAPYPSIEDGHAAINYQRVFAPGITFLIEISEDLQIWEPYLAEEVLLGTTNGVQTWRAIDPQLTTDSRRRFLRVKAICP